MQGRANNKASEAGRQAGGGKREEQKRNLVGKRKGKGESELHKEHPSKKPPGNRKKAERELGTLQTGGGEAPRHCTETGRIKGHSGTGHEVNRGVVRGGAAAEAVKADWARLWHKYRPQACCLTAVRKR